MFDMSLVETGIKPAPATPDDIAAIGELAPGDYEIFSEKLNMILEEGNRVMTMKGISSMLHSGDTMTGIYTAGGQESGLIAGATALAALLAVIGAVAGWRRAEPGRWFG